MASPVHSPDAKSSNLQFQKIIKTNSVSNIPAMNTNTNSNSNSNANINNNINNNYRNNIH